MIKDFIDALRFWVYGKLASNSDVRIRVLGDVGIEVKSLKGPNEGVVVNQGSILELLEYQKYTKSKRFMTVKTVKGYVEIGFVEVGRNGRDS